MESIQFLHKILGSRMVICVQQRYLNLRGCATDSQILKSRRPSMTFFTDLLLSTGLTRFLQQTRVIILDSRGYSEIARSVFMLN